MIVARLHTTNAITAAATATSTKMRVSLQMKNRRSEA